MKKLTKFLMAALLAGMCSFGYAQDYMKDPKPNEKVIGFVSVEKVYHEYNDYTVKNESTLVRWYETLMKEAQRQFPGTAVDIRNMELVKEIDSRPGWFLGPAHGKVVDLHDPQAHAYGDISQAINKAFRNVREGSRIAIDQVTVLNSMNREEMKDQIIDVLLNKGYKVVAKEYLDKLYEEQLNQQSGIYNDRTTVQENNFSAVGYYVNVKVTETSLRVQVINVSTGEYEGNATVNF